MGVDQVRPGLFERVEGLAVELHVEEVGHQLGVRAVDVRYEFGRFGDGIEKVGIVAVVGFKRDLDAPWLAEIGAQVQEVGDLLARFVAVEAVGHPARAAAAVADDLDSSPLHEVEDPRDKSTQPVQADVGADDHQPASLRVANKAAHRLHLERVLCQKR